MMRHIRNTSLILASISICLATVQVALSQGNPEPEMSPWVRYNLHHFVEVRDSVLRDCSDFPLVRVVSDASGPIWMMSIEVLPDSHMIVRTAQSDNSLGLSALVSAEERTSMLRKAHITRHQKEIPKADALKIARVFERVIDKTMYSSYPVLASGLDGAIYSFSVQSLAVGTDYKSGCAWSPDEGTPAGYLVAIAWNLLQYAGAEPAIEAKYLQDVNKKLWLLGN
jgi:hypothetical protein